MTRRLIIAIALVLVATACSDQDSILPPPTAAPPTTLSATSTTEAPATTATTIPATTTTAMSETTTTAAPTTTTTTLDPDLGLVWERVPHREKVFGGPGSQSMNSVVAGGPGLVAVGSDISEGGEDSVAAVWTSVDGVEWERVRHREKVFGGPGFQNMNSVVAGGPGLVAVGNDTSEGGEDSVAAVWTSVDGMLWERVSHDDEALGGPVPRAMRSVVAGGPGLVAVGYAGVLSTVVDGQAAVWTSVDGLVWERVRHREKVFGGPGFQSMSSVVAGGPGLVAVGNDTYEDWADRVAAVWTSVDGMVWKRVPHDDEVFGGPGFQSMIEVVAGGPGLVAVGYDGAVAAVWTSVDGVVWERVPHREKVFGGPGSQRMNSVVAGGPGLVAVGNDYSEGWEDSVAAVWTSVDGVEWERVRHREKVFGGTGFQNMNSVVAGGPGLVAVGYDGASAAVWVTPPRS